MKNIIEEFGSFFEEELNKDSKRFQDGLFTAFHCLTLVGLKEDLVLKILTTWEENNKLDSSDYKNLKENYFKYKESYEKDMDSYKKIKDILK